MSMRSALGAALLAATVLLVPVSGAGAACDPGVELVISMLRERVAGPQHRVGLEAVIAHR